jgi:hypothetical protein
MGRLKLAIFLHLTAADPWEKISQQSLRLLRDGESLWRRPAPVLAAVAAAIPLAILLMDYLVMDYLATTLTGCLLTSRQTTA